jgi:membrane peptidoglycan carboxypeptidase
LLESAILAGLPQRPSYYSPLIGTKDAWKARTKDVLRRMREDGYISKPEEQENLKKIDSVQFTSQKFAIQAPHFLFYVKDELEKIYGYKIFDEGIKVKTTLNAKIQEKVEEIVKKEINTIRKLNATNAAVVVLDSKTNEILAMVGSYDYFDEKFGKFNAALGLRQPGSTVKPITYAVAFEKGYTPATLLMDVKTVFPVEGDGDYIPVNYDGNFEDRFS